MNLKLPKTINNSFIYIIYLQKIYILYTQKSLKNKYFNLKNQLYTIYLQNIYKISTKYFFV
jgi:hypothetical protein